MNADIVKLAGGGDVITDHARAHFEAGRPLGAIHLLDIAFYAAPDNAHTLKVKKAALEHLLIASGGSNLCESMWLKSEIAHADN